MPWHLDNDNADCSGWAVVKDSTGEVVGCHKTRKEALAHMSALYANEPEADSLPPTARSAPMIEPKSPMVERKSFVVEADDEPGTFTGYAAVFDNEDSYGDVMVKGAFSESISVRGLPVLSWEHEWSAGPIGVLSSAIEDDYGLRITGRLFLSSDLPSRIYEAMRAGQVQEMSFAFIAKDTENGSLDGRPVRYVKAVDWLEAAIVVKGANDGARLVAVRSEADLEAALGLGPEADARLEARIEEALQRINAANEAAAAQAAEESARRDYLASLLFDIEQGATE